MQLQVDAGGAGGPGGFRVCDRSGHSGGTYTAFVGGGGAYAGNCEGMGGGGGATRVSRPDGGPVLVAGGGGGGSAVWANGGGYGLAPTVAKAEARVRLWCEQLLFRVPGAQDGGGWSRVAVRTAGTFMRSAAYAGSNPGGQPAAETAAHTRPAGWRILTVVAAAATVQAQPYGGGSGGGGCGYNPFDGA